MHLKAKVGVSVVMVKISVVVLRAMWDVQMFLIVMELFPLRRRCTPPYD